MQPSHQVNITTSIFDPLLDHLIVSQSEKCTFSEKFIFSRPGETMDYIFYIQKGTTKHYMTSEEGVIKLLYVLTDGWFFGETPCFMGEATGLFSQTEEPTILYKIPKNICLELLNNNELFRQHVIRCYSEKCLILRHEIANLSFNSSKRRLKRLFCSAIDYDSRNNSSEWYDLNICYTHQELGEIIGTSRVTISRQINELCNDGFLRVVNRKMQVHKKLGEKYLLQSPINE